MDLKTKINSLSERLYPEILETRNHLHMHPELSFAESATSDYIASELTNTGITFRRGFVKTGIVATLNMESEQPLCIAIRADMDALPIEEMNDIPYKSVYQGIMHACGHDVHMSVLLGCIKILKELKDELKAKFYFIFQPGEEKLPGGAKLMLEEGIFFAGEPDVILGLHVLPSLDSGKVGFRQGIYMASTDELYITVKGKGGHAAMPQDNVDPVLIASHIVVALQQLVSRRANPALPTVLSIGKFIANGATNVIPDTVQLEGTFRTFDEQWRIEAHAKMKQLAGMLAESMGGSCDFEVRNGYPVLVNDAAATRLASQFAGEYLGNEKVTELDLRMTAEDFAYFTQKYPAVFFRLGVRNKVKNIVSALHTAGFNIDEDALRTGMGTMAYIAASMAIKGLAK